MQKVPDPRTAIRRRSYSLRMLARVWISLFFFVFFDLQSFFFFQSWLVVALVLIDSRAMPHVQTSKAGAHRVWDGTILGYVHTYPGLFENGAFRPRIHRNGHTYPHVSGAFRKRSRKWIFRKRRFRIRIFFACEHGIRIFSATVSKAIKNGLPTR